MLERKPNFETLLTCCERWTGKDCWVVLVRFENIGRAICNRVD